MAEVKAADWQIVTPLRVLPANRDKNEPTSGLEPLTCSSYECAVGAWDAVSYRKRQRAGRPFVVRKPSTEYGIVSLSRYKG
jgi:hypothetical protein